MLILKIAFRNIFRNKRRSVFTSITMIIGFVLTALTISVQNGSYDKIISGFTKNSIGDLQVHEKTYLESPSVYKTIPESLKLDNLMKKSIKAKSVLPKIKGGALAFTNSTPSPILLEGISPEKTKEFTNFKNTILKGKFFSQKINKPIVKKHNPASLTKGDFDEDFDEDEGDLDEVSEVYEIIINRNIAKKLEVSIGEKIYLISQGADGSTANDVFTVVGITSKNNATLEYKAYIPLKTAQEFFTLQGRIHEYTISINNYKNSRTASAKINKLPELQKNNISAKPWQEVEKEFYKAMQGDKEGSNILFFIIIIIVIIGVLNTVLMSILERKREFGVLKAIGTRGKFIFKMIVLESFILSSLSILLGMIIFSLLNIYFVTNGIPLAEPVSIGDFQMNSIHGFYTIEEYITPSITIIMSAIIVSLYPAFKASKTKPIDALRSY